ncbi:MAG: asparaginase domain-containing protein [Eubacteriales bacterium]|nr:asparaginase domain-containing protein [Eubacteriales bacterium]
MKKILVIATGGTIASVKDTCIHLDRPFKILDFVNCDAEFECKSPFSVLSENIDLTLWDRLIEFIDGCDIDKYAGVIILHGSDTLAFTGALLANLYCDKTICLVASDKPLEDSTSNGVRNFTDAVEFILSGNNGVVISYDGIKPADCTASADGCDKFIVAGRPQPKIESPHFSPKNILVITPYPNIDYDSYCLDNVDAVLHTMYHSATAPQNALSFALKCRERGISISFITTKEKAEYETSAGFEDIVYGCTIENAYARELLK